MLRARTERPAPAQAKRDMMVAPRVAAIIRRHGLSPQLAENLVPAERLIEAVLKGSVGACVDVPPASEPGLRATSRCESGRRIQVSYPSDSAAVVVHEGRTLRMTLAVSASGARYVGGGLEWWTKGSGPGSPGTLFRHLDDGTSGEAVEQCEQE